MASRSACDRVSGSPWPWRRRRRARRRSSRGGRRRGAGSPRRGPRARAPRCRRRAPPRRSRPAWGAAVVDGVLAAGVGGDGAADGRAVPRGGVDPVLPAGAAGGGLSFDPALHNYLAPFAELVELWQARSSRSNAYESLLLLRGVRASRSAASRRSLRTTDSAIYRPDHARNREGRARARTRTAVGARIVRAHECENGGMAADPRLVLVPGGFTGAWMWADVVGLLEREGIEGLAVELPTIGEDAAGADF